jgi:predicted RNA-binding protein with PIN domain
MHKIYLVDGYNLLHASDDMRKIVDAFGMDRARIELLKGLGEFSRRSDADCVVVFDGIARMNSSPKGVRVVSSGNRSADEVIREQVRAMGRKLVVVTDDLEIIATARTNMATVVSSREFASRIDVIVPGSATDQARREARAAARPHRIEELRERGEKPRPPDDDEIDEWKKLFGA